MKRHEKDCLLLQRQTFQSIEHKNDALRNYCEKYLTRDVRSALFISCDFEDSEIKLSLSIKRGLKKQWILDEFVETDSGYLPRWYLANQSVT